MSEFVNVPVPSHLVLAVMRFLAAAEAVQGADSPASSSPAPDSLAPDSPTSSSQAFDSKGGSVPWTRQDLKVIQDHRGDKTSVDLFARVLSYLAPLSPNKIHRDDIADALGTDGVKLSNTFGRFTTFAANRVGPEKGWPLSFEPGHRWGLDKQTADDWTSIVNES